LLFWRRYPLFRLLLLVTSLLWLTPGSCAAQYPRRSRPSTDDTDSSDRVLAEKSRLSAEFRRTATGGSGCSDCASVQDRPARSILMMEEATSSTATSANEDKLDGAINPVRRHQRPAVPATFGAPPAERRRARPIRGWLARDSGFNEFASDRIGPRTSPARLSAPLACRKNNWTAAGLPNTSVIVCAHNEAWSALLRTLHSVLDRSPPNLLHEVILVDDASTRPQLGRPLEDYLAELGRVPLGWRRGRNWPDAHFPGLARRMREGWLEPLLDRVARSRRTVAVPYIDVVSSESLAFLHVAPERMTAVSTGRVWRSPGARGARRGYGGTSQAAPIQCRAPLCQAALFTIDRAFFAELGGYDRRDGDLGQREISSSASACGCAAIKAESRLCPARSSATCFAPPYTWGKSGAAEVLKRNAIRLAEVWLDGFKHILYRQFNYRLGDFGDTSRRGGSSDEGLAAARSAAGTWTTRLPGTAGGAVVASGGPITPPPFAWVQLRVATTLSAASVCLDSRLSLAPCQDTDNGEGSLARLQSWCYEPLKRRLIHSASGRCLAVLHSAAVPVPAAWRHCLPRRRGRAGQRKSDDDFGLAWELPEPLDLSMTGPWRQALQYRLCQSAATKQQRISKQLVILAKRNTLRIRSARPENL
uniref:Glyco_trans_2-like domain-containing protein n=1 Tax=Macrostomum lignano TaxID=282301 RepID=A0A1I8FED4_9PLAT